MIDYLALALTHALIVLALMRILARGELDREDPLADTVAEADKAAERTDSRARNRRKRSGDA